MKDLTIDTQKRLSDIFKDRVNYKLYERRLYSSDIGVMPRFVKNRIQSLPVAVILPKDEDEIMELFKVSREQNIPLVPRGIGTSGYGGSIPAQGGISVVFSQMNKVIDIDDTGKTVTVQPGIIWKDLERKLNVKDLMLRLYPSSFPGSTVGGWLAQGGIGIGSYKYGPFYKNIEKVKIITPDGSKKTFSGEELSLISGSIGTIGIITELTFKVQKKQDVFEELLSFSDIKDLKDFIRSINKDGIPLWSVTCINPGLARLKNKLDEKSNIKLPEGKYLTLLSFFASDKDTIEKYLDEKKYLGYETLDQELAQEEWKQRFYTIRVKKLGPSVVPSEVIIPLEKADEFFRKVTKKIKFDYLAEIIVTDDGNLTILGFILSDERKFSFTTTFTSSISVIKIAEGLGGKVYSTGLYFTYKSPDVLGQDTFDKIVQLKKDTDPDNLLNPGKLFYDNGINKSSSKKIDLLMKAAERFEWSFPLIRNIFGNKSIGRKRTKKMSEDLLWNATICAQCGYCVQACELYESRFWESSSPRGKWKLLKDYQEGKTRINNEIVNTFLMCTTCKRCDPVCQVDIPIMDLWNRLRGELVEDKHFATFPAFEMMAASYNHEGNIWAELRQDRADWVPPDTKVSQDSDTLYWAGCTASYVTQDIAKNAVRILDAADQDFTVLGTEETCCGIPFYMAGKWDVFEKAVRTNIENINKKGIKKVIISCPGCWVTFNDLYKEWAAKLGLDYDIEIEHITQAASRLIKEGKLIPKKQLEETVTYHDPCHIGRHGNIYEEPRDIIKAIPGMSLKEMEHNKDDALCCGSVLTRAGEPNPTSDYLGKIRIDEAIDIDAATILTTCPCCEVQLRVSAKNNTQEMKIMDITDALARSLGFEVSDYTPKTLKSWDVFGQMIDYMTPREMAVMMDELMDKIIDMMPGYMKAMIKIVNKMPGFIKDLMYKMMAKMMPVLMPKLLPSMMPKMMDDILGYYYDRVPNMPVSMKKLMPVMMPEVMDKLMPSMLPDVVPLILDDMIGTLKIHTFK